MLLMLITGTTNMLFAKFQHMQHVPMYPGGPAEPFYHPWLQAGFMMVEERLCSTVKITAVGRHSNSEFSFFIPIIVIYIYW